MTEAPDGEPLGSLEAELLHILWDADDWVAAPVLHERLTQARPLAYTTVSTVLIRLWNKGHLDRVREGRSFAYRALQTKEQFAATRMAGWLADLTDRPTALSWFVQFLDATERAQLRRLLTRDRDRR